MVRTYQYKGFRLEVAIEANFSWPRQIMQTPSPTYVAIVSVERTGGTKLSPLRLGDADGKAYSTEGDALMTGYSTARRIVDSLMAAETH